MATHTLDSTATSHPRALNIALWIAQALLAAAFLMAGGMKLVTPMEQLTATMPMSGLFLRFIGVVEVAGAIGVVVPAATRIQPRLTIFAALGLLIVMVGAFITHLTRSEYSSLVAPLVLGALAAFVAWGRAKKAPIAPH
jgi:putative oxidoreductase